MNLLGFNLGYTLPLKNLSASELNAFVSTVIIICVTLIIITIIRSVTQIIIARIQADRHKLRRGERENNNKDKEPDQ